MTGSVPHFTVFWRDGCSHCETLIEDLRSAPQAASWHIEVVDVDADPATRRRYGHKVPVLLLDGELVCDGAFDLEEVRKALAVRL